MVTKKELAKVAAKIAAKEAYKAIMSAQTVKVASKRTSSIDTKKVAETAAVAAYAAVIKSAQEMTRPPLNYGAFGAALEQLGLNNFAQYVLYRGAKAIGNKRPLRESWAKPERWSDIRAAILSDQKATEAQLKPIDEMMAKAVGTNP